MKRLAIIPARSGSKGLPGKNLMTINGETLVARAVRCARESGMFLEVMVSSDDNELALAAGADSIHIRPKHLAADDSNIEDTITDILGCVFGYDLLALLQPTSPTRTPEIVRECVRAVGETYRAAWTVSRVPDKYHADMQLENRGGWLRGDGMKVRNRQTLTPRYIKNGLCYAVHVPSFRLRGLDGGGCRTVVTPGPALTIDTQEDLDEARRLLER